MRAKGNWKQLASKLVIQNNHRLFDLVVFIQQNRTFLGKKRIVRTFSTKAEDVLEEKYLDDALSMSKDLKLVAKISETFEEITKEKVGLNITEKIRE
jgi:hypothetical protein